MNSDDSSRNLCPLCGSRILHDCYTVLRADLDSLSYLVRRCAECDLTFATGEFSQELMERIYSRFFYNSGQQTVPHLPNGELAPEADRWPVLANAHERVAWLRKQGFSGSLLDIGAGRGYFVKSAQSDFDAAGIELHEEAASFARAMGANVFAGDFLTHDFQGRGYDIVTLWDVFSGFLEPDRTLERLLSLVSRGGRLVMTLPDSDSALARMLGRRWPLMIPPGNMRFYNARSLATLLNRPTVASYSVDYHSKVVNVRFLAHKLVRALGMHQLSEKNWMIPAHWKVRLNLRDIMTVTIVKA